MLPSPARYVYAAILHLPVNATVLNSAGIHLPGSRAWSIPTTTLAPFNTQRIVRTLKSRP